MKKINFLLLMGVLFYITAPAVQATPQTITAEELLAQHAKNHETTLACGSYWDPRCD